MYIPPRSGGNESLSELEHPPDIIIRDGSGVQEWQVVVYVPGKRVPL